MARKSQAARDVAFGEAPTFSSEQQIAYHLSDDRKSFEIRFDTALAAGVGTAIFDGAPKTDAPVTTRVYSAVIPVSGGGLKTSFVVNGFGKTEAGTGTMLLLKVNERQSVTRFKPKAGNQEAFLVALPYQAEEVADVRLTIALLAERDSAHADGSALIAVTDISADAAFSRKKPARRKGAKKKK